MVQRESRRGYRVNVRYVDDNCGPVRDPNVGILVNERAGVTESI
jgi:hypothetical protein